MLAAEKCKWSYPLCMSQNDQSIDKSVSCEEAKSVKKLKIKTKSLQLMLFQISMLKHPMFLQNKTTYLSKFSKRERKRCNDIITQH